MKNFFKPKVRAEILARLDKLQPDSKPLWGKMNINQCVVHMMEAFDTAVGRRKPKLQYLPLYPPFILRYFLLHTKYKRGPLNEREIDDYPKYTILPEYFEDDLACLKSSIENCYNSKTFVPRHVIAGKFSKKQWGKFIYNHTNHHLKQFGV